jgi:hypothetical protein
MAERSSTFSENASFLLHRLSENEPRLEVSGRSLPPFHPIALLAFVYARPFTQNAGEPILLGKNVLYLLTERLAEALKRPLAGIIEAKGCEGVDATDA